MNNKLRKLMVEAGYAAPELAGRAQKLAELLIQECQEIANSAIENRAAYRSDCISNVFGQSNQNDTSGNS